MNSEINLISRNQKQKRQIRRLFFISILCFGLIAAFSTGILVYNLTLKANASAIDSQILEYKSKNASLSKQKEQALALRDRLSNIQKLLTSKKKVVEKLLAVLDEFPESIGIKEMKADDDVISIRVSSFLLSDFEPFVGDKIIEFGKSNKVGIKRIDLSGFSASSKGYELSLDYYFSIKKKE